jgi:hypothetical protein
MTEKKLSVVWELERVSRAPWHTPPFELNTPLLRGTGAPPSLVVVNRTYVIQRRADGTVLHTWGEKEHIDCESVWEGAWEVAIYAPELQNSSSWNVWVDRQKETVDLPPRETQIKPQQLFLINEVDGIWTFKSNLPSGEWIRQSMSPEGRYMEERHDNLSVGLFHVKQKPWTWPYDAILVTTEGLEEKFILRGELSR